MNKLRNINFLMWTFGKDINTFILHLLHLSELLRIHYFAVRGILVGHLSQAAPAHLVKVRGSLMWPKRPSMIWPLPPYGLLSVLPPRVPVAQVHLLLLLNEPSPQTQLPLRSLVFLAFSETEAYLAVVLDALLAICPCLRSFCKTACRAVSSVSPASSPW